jgi:hypothetical protein
MVPAQLGRHCRDCFAEHVIGLRFAREPLARNDGGVSPDLWMAFEPSILHIAPQLM